MRIVKCQNELLQSQHSACKVQRSEKFGGLVGKFGSWNYF